jgi:hypothetical protein
MGMKLPFTPLLLLWSTAAGALAQSYVDSFGTHGWYSDDTRDGSVAKTDSAYYLWGLDYTHPSYLNGSHSGSVAADAEIAERISWTTPSIDAPNGLGALYLTTGAAIPGSSGKATLSLLDSDGFASSTTLLDSSFFGSLTYYNPDSAQLALRINIKVQNPPPPTPGTTVPPGEDTWDLALVYVGSGTGGWTTNTISATEGLWSVYRSVDTGYPTNLPERQTLAQIFSNPTWGGIIFNETSAITNIQLGVGSSSALREAYVSSLQLSFLNNGRPFEFVDPSKVADVTTLAPTYTATTSQVFQVTGTVGEPTDVVSVSGTDGATATFSVQDAAVLTLEKLTIDAGGVLTGAGTIDGDVVVESGGVLQGANDVFGETKVAGGAHHKPGFSPAAVYSAGNYVLEEAILEIEIGGLTGAGGEFDNPVTGEFDQLFFGDGIELTFATIEIAQWNNFDLQLGDTFNILYSTSIDIAGLDIVGVGEYADWDFSYTVISDAAFGSGTYQALQVTVVPEPGTFGLIALSTGLSLLLRRRSRRVAS